MKMSKIYALVQASDFISKLELTQDESSAAVCSCSVCKRLFHVVPWPCLFINKKKYISQTFDWFRNLEKIFKRRRTLLSWRQHQSSNKGLTIHVTIRKCLVYPMIDLKVCTTKVVNVFRAFTIEHLEKEPLFQTFIFFLFWIRIIKLSMILKIGSSASHSFL